MKTINNYIMTDLFQNERKIKAKISSGFASVQQKSSLVKLKVIADTTIIIGGSTLDIKKGSFVLIKEELLYTQKHLTQQYEIEGSDVKFMLIDAHNIVGVV